VVLHRCNELDSTHSPELWHGSKCAREFERSERETLKERERTVKMRYGYDMPKSEFCLTPWEMGTERERALLALFCFCIALFVLCKGGFGEGALPT